MLPDYDKWTVAELVAEAEASLPAAEEKYVEREGTDDTWREHWERQELLVRTLCGKLGIDVKSLSWRLPVDSTVSALREGNHTINGVSIDIRRHRSSKQPASEPPVGVEVKHGSVFVASSPMIPVGPLCSVYCEWFDTYEANLAAALPVLFENLEKVKAISLLKEALALSNAQQHVLLDLRDQELNPQEHPQVHALEITLNVLRRHRLVNDNKAGRPTLTSKGRQYANAIQEFINYAYTRLE